MSVTAAQGPGSLRRTPPDRRRASWLYGSCLLVALLAVLVVVWAHTRPGFDPYGWLTWGHQVVFGTLDTNAAPSWKPLPFLFTTLFALAGSTQVLLWMWFSIAVSLSGIVFAYRIAHRLTTGGAAPGSAAEPRRRRAAVAAGVFAGLALLLIQDYPHYILSAQSDPMIVALCLGAVDCALSGRPRAALTLALLGSLGRPEVFPFLGLYGLWCWRAVPAMRWLILAELIVLLALWFGIPALTSRSPFVAGDNAIGSPRALHHDPVGGTLARYFHLLPWPLQLTALVSAGVAAWRRERVVLILTACVVIWVGVECGFAVHGWAALPRYMFEAGGAAAVVAATGVGRALAGDLPSHLLRTAAAGVVVAVLAAGALVPSAVSDVRTERLDLQAQRQRTDIINRLSRAVDAVGGARRLHPCGEALISLQYQSILAWRLHLNVARIGWKFPRAIASGRPIVLFSLKRDGGWRIHAVHQRAASCRSLPN